MYIRVYDEKQNPLVVVTESDFGTWLEESDHSIVDFVSSEDICTAVVEADDK